MIDPPKAAAVEALLAEGRRSEARAACDSLVESGSATAFDLLQAGQAYEALEDPVAAMRAYRAALTKDASSGHAHNAVGRLLLSQGNAGLAVEPLQRAVDLDPANSARLTLLGVALLQLGDRMRGLDCLGEAVRADPNAEEAHYNIAVEIASERPDDAQRHLRRAIAIDPHYAIAHRELAHLLAGLGELGQAEPHFEQAFSLDSKDPWTLVYWGTARWQAQDGEGAQRKFEAAIEAAPAFAVAKWSLGALLEDRGQKAAAKAWYEAALRDDPGDEVAAGKLLRLVDGQGRH